MLQVQLFLGGNRAELWQFLGNYRILKRLRGHRDSEQETSWDGKERHLGGSDNLRWHLWRPGVLSIHIKLQLLGWWYWVHSFWRLPVAVLDDAKASKLNESSGLKKSTVLQLAMPQPSEVQQECWLGHPERSWYEYSSQIFDRQDANHGWTSWQCWLDPSLDAKEWGGWVHE